MKAHNQQGVAIFMVLTAVTILALVLADFSFETTVNQLKVYNQQDQAQARLNAESGLNMALARLRLYQEARNLLEKNENMKSVIQPSMIESLLLQPFAYPIPLDPGSNPIQRSALEEFEANVLFRGQVMVSIRQISGFLNPNNMRVERAQNQEENGFSEPPPDDEDGEQKKSPAQFMEQKLVETLERLIEDRREVDPIFDNRYGHLDPELLIKEIKYYISDPEQFEDVARGEIEARYLAKDLTPKHAPLSSLDELYLLEGWPDEMVDLIKDYLTVHEVAIIAVNELTADLLKVLFPYITDVQIEEFFLYRRGDPERGLEPQEFKSPEDFKNVVVNRIGIIGEQDYDERIREFEAAGMRIGVAGKFFEVTSTGQMERATYNLKAYIDLPIQPQVWQPPQNNPNPGGGAPQGEDDEEPPPAGGNQPERPNQTATELMAPRVIELRLE